MVYATWSYYRETYYGELIENEVEFQRLVREASAFLDELTQDRAKDFDDIEDKLKNAACAVAEIRKEYADGLKGIKSESIGKESVTYALAESKTMESESYAAVKQYLYGTDLLYLGINKPPESEGIW